MSRRRISSGTPFEDLASFSRAVVDGDMVYVSGTTGMDRETGTFPEEAAAQTRLALGHGEAARGGAVWRRMKSTASVVSTSVW